MMTRARRAGIDYLCQPDGEYDPPVYDMTGADVLEKGVLGECRFFSCKVPNDELARYEYFEEFIEFAVGADLVFFDPDIGIEPPSSKGPQYVHCTSWPVASRGATRC